jgi:hypothetical protein
MESGKLRLNKGIKRGKPFEIMVNSAPYTAYPGETLATVLLATGRFAFRLSPVLREPRGLFCGMGICFECLLTVNGRPNVRACVTVVQPGDRVEIQLND